VSTNANENRAGGDAELAHKEFADTTIRVRYAETDQMGVVYYGKRTAGISARRGLMIC
jgi:hypothetical protein